MLPAVQREGKDAGGTERKVVDQFESKAIQHQEAGQITRLHVCVLMTTIPAFR